MVTPYVSMQVCQQSSGNYLFRTAVYLGNRQSIGGKNTTPQTVWYGTVSETKQYRAWGCTAYVHIPDKHRRKLDKKCWKGIFVSYKSNTSKIYYIWHPNKRQLCEAQSVQFNDHSFEWKEKSPVTHNIEQSDYEETDDEYNNSKTTKLQFNVENKITNHENINEQPPSTCEESNIKTQDAHISPEVIISNNLRRSSRIRKPTAKAADMLSNRQKSNAAIELIYLAARDTNIDVPVSYEAALQTEQADKQIEAYDSEISSLVEHGTFSALLDYIPNNKHAITAKIVLDLKRGENSEIIRYKARLVARGFAQKYGINFEETFAPKIRLDALRIILAIAARENWEIHQMDVMTAFLAGELEDEVYIKMPNHMVSRFGRYVRVLKSLHGLKQAARVWYLLLSEFLTSISFICVSTDQTILTNPITKVVIRIHVDDLIITGPNKKEIVLLKDQLGKGLRMKDLGNARKILGIRINRVGECLMIHQSQYDESIVKDFYISGTKIYSTPMANDAVGELVCTPGRPCTDEELQDYWRLLGKLMYLCNKRPNIVFATHKLAKFSHKACYNHWLALLRILSYVEGTIGYGIRYGSKHDEIPYLKQTIMLRYIVEVPKPVI